MFWCINAYASFLCVQICPRVCVLIIVQKWSACISPSTSISHLYVEGRMSYHTHHTHRPRISLIVAGNHTKKKAHVPHIPSYSPIIASLCPLHERLFEGQLFQTTARIIKRNSQSLHKTIQDITSCKFHKIKNNQTTHPKSHPQPSPCQLPSEPA